MSYLKYKDYNWTFERATTKIEQISKYKDHNGMAL